jgi:hypothetical protein
MSVNFLKRRNILKSANALDLIPIILIKYELAENNLVKLIVPRFQNKLLKKIFHSNKLKPEFKVTLDEIGSIVWLTIDGQKNIETIIEKMIEHFQNKGSEVNSPENRVIAFLTMLYQEDYITFRQLE